MLNNTILFVVDDIYPNTFGGMQMHSYRLVNEWLKLGENICLFYPFQSNDNLPAHFKDYIDSGQLVLKALKKNKTYNYPWSYLLEELRFAFRVKKAAKLFAKRVVYTQGLVGLFLPQYDKKNTIHITNPHGLEPFQNFFKYKKSALVYRFLFKQIFKKASFIVSLGGNLSDILAQIGVSKSKIVKMPNGIGKHWVITEEKIREPKDELNILFIGRNEPRKGLSLLVEAWLKVEMPKATLTVVGPFEQEYNTAYKKQISFTGSISDENELLKVYDNHDILICPSLAEGMPTVLLEAMARGLAIVATNVGATAELINFENGWLIEPNNIQELINVLIELNALEKNQLMNKKVQSIKKVKKYTWDLLGRSSLKQLVDLCE